MGDGLAPGQSPAAIVAEAMRLAEANPAAALAALERVQLLVADGGRRLQGLELAARGRAEHQLGRRPSASGHLRLAVDILREEGDESAATAALMHLSAERIDAGAFDEAVGALDAALPGLHGADEARALAQKAVALARSGRVAPAIPVWDRTIASFDAAGLELEAAVARQNRGVARLYTGDLEGAEADLLAAGRAFQASGQEIRAMEVVHNLGCVSVRRGDMPAALERFDEAQAKAAHLRALRPQMLVDRIEATIDAGLAGEGRRLAEASIALLEAGGHEADLPEACLLAARSCQADHDFEAALAWSSRAAELFERQGRPRWGLLAELAAARARLGACPPGSGEPLESLDSLSGLARRLRLAGWTDAWVEAECLCADMILARHDAARLAPILAELGRAFPELTVLGRLRVRLVQAQAALSAGDILRSRRYLISAVRSLRAYQATIGSAELRSYGGGHGEEIVAAGFRLASGGGRPSDALWCTEAVRDSTGGLTGPPDPEVLGLVARLRDMAEQAARTPPAESTRLRRQQAATEELVRRLSRHRRGTGVGSPAVPADLVGPDGNLTIVEYGIADGMLMAVVAQGGSGRVVRCGNSADAVRLAAGLRLALRVSSAERPGSASVPPAGQHLEESALAAERLLWEPLGVGGADRLVIVPDPALASMPWGVLPSLRSVELSVARSATAWHRAARTAASGPVVLLAGPGLRHAEEEIDTLADVWGNGTVVVRPKQATVAEFTRVARSAGVLHVAAHATHRGDNPILSGIRLADGHITGYELASMSLSCRLVVLSCCDTGMADTGTGLGLARLLSDSGVAAVIASVSPLDDRSAVPVMRTLHRHVAGSAGPAAALALTRAEVEGTANFGTAAGLVSFGAG